MWDSNLAFSKTNDLCKVTIFQNSRLLTFEEVIEYWKVNAKFRQFYISLISNLPYEAIFWESPAIKRGTIGRKYEFVAVESQQLASVKANSAAFSEYFNSVTPDNSIVSFENLRGDSKLVVPCPLRSSDSYTHLTKFLREAPEHQCHEFFQALGVEVGNRLDRHPLWLSTSGLGVHWLHARLDRRPKYYTYAPYREAK